MRSQIWLLGAALLFAVTEPGAAQESAANANASDPLPNLTATAHDLADERKYFILHKAGVTIEQAEQDFSFCWRYLPRGVARSTPDFVPWRTSPDIHNATQHGSNFGLVGDVIGAMIAGPIERSMRQSRIFRCMVPRGYRRYRTSEALWKQLNEGDPVRAIHVQARIAAGPVPQTPEVTQ